MRGRVGFEALGRDWTLRLTSNALCRIEEATGIGAIEFFSRFDGKSLRIGDLRIVLQHGIEGEALTAEQAGDLIDALGLTAAAERVTQALTLAFPDDSAADAPAPVDAAGNGAGTAAG